MSSFVFERMRVFTWKDRFKVRTWLKCETLDDKHWLAVASFLRTYFEETDAPDDVEEAAMALAQMFTKELAAVEVTKMSGNGVVIYTEWP